jgi:GntR family transcriptional regulator / MocR family aminotransferase
MPAVATPRWRRVYQDLRQAIEGGGLHAGARLPSSRVHAAALGVSRNTVLTALAQLAAEGYVEGRVGAGTFVTSPVGAEAAGSAADHAAAADATAGVVAGPATPPPTAAPLATFGARALAARPWSPPTESQLPFDFRYGTATSDLGLTGRWRRLLRRTPAPIDYGDAAGYPPLRRALAGYLERRRGVRTVPEDVIVTSGSQQALDLLARVVLDPGASALVEDPVYQGARGVLAAYGATLVGMPVDGDGARVPARPPRGVRLAYVTPSHQFPTGAVMSLARRRALLSTAARHGFWVIEDDYDAEFRYDVRPIPALQGLDRSGRVAYVGTFSKVLFPALRLGYLVAPPALKAPLLAAKWLADRHTPTLEQATMAEFIDSGDFERHLDRGRRRHALRRAALVRALERHLAEDAVASGTASGVHALVRHPGVPRSRVRSLLDAARERGVGLYDSAPYYLRRPPAAAEILVGYGALEPEAIDEGVRRWAAALRCCLR